MIDVRLNLMVPERFRPAGDTPGVHPVVPYARHGLDPRERSTGLEEMFRRRPRRRDEPEGSPRQIDEWV